MRPAGCAGTVLVGAEAGGGKSRLVSEFTARVAGRALVLAGGCVELSAAGLPYAPFTAALRQLVRERGAAGVAALLGGRDTGELAGLLPEFGAPPAGADPDMARARLFELLLALLEALAEPLPLVLVVEDVHWADHPTRDLLSFLVRNLRHAAVLLVVTFRSAELHRTHPLRPLLAELSRMAGVTRVELPRLSRGQVDGAAGRHLGPPARTRRDERGLPARRRDPAVHRGPGQRRRHREPRAAVVAAGSAAGRGEGAARADPAGAARRHRRRRPRRPRAAGRGDRAR